MSECLRDTTTRVFQCFVCLVDRSGHRKDVAQARQDGTFKQESGKSYMRIVMFRFLAQKSMTNEAGDWELAMFAHLYLLQLWNIMFRVSSGAAEAYAHITYGGEDNIEIVVPTEKNNQDGSTIGSRPRHLHANPLDPPVCLFLAFAMWFFSRSGFTPDRAPLLFGRENQDDRFGTWLQTIIEKFEEEIKEKLGFEIPDTGCVFHRVDLYACCWSIVLIFHII